MTPLSSTLNKVLTKLQTGHTLSAASHSGFLCVPSMYHSILHSFENSVVKLVEPVIVLIYKGQAAGPNPHKFTWYDCSGQCHFDRVLGSSKQALGEASPVSNVRLDLIVPAEKQDGG